MILDDPKVRTPWWRLKFPEPPDLLLSYMSNQAPRLIANRAGVLTTNLIHNVRLRRLFYPGLDATLLALAWPNSATLLSCETAGRAYGGGVLKLETREAERVLVPSLGDDVGDMLRRSAPEIDLAVRRGELEAAADLLDPIVLARLSGEHRAALRAGWLDLRQRRRLRAMPASC